MSNSKKDTYTEKEVLSLIKGAKSVHEDTHTLPLDHERRIGVYDVEQVGVMLESKTQRELLQDIFDGDSIEQIAKRNHLSKKTIERRLQDIAKELKQQLNGEKSKMDKVIILKEKKGVPTVIEYNGLRYILNHKDTHQPKEKKNK